MHDDERSTVRKLAKLQDGDNPRVLKAGLDSRSLEKVLSAVFGVERRFQQLDGDLMSTRQINGSEDLGGRGLSNRPEEPEARGSTIR
jgi:hypothetical protein